jgi:hypothetical protein
VTVDLLKEFSLGTHPQKAQSRTLRLANEAQSDGMRDMVIAQLDQALGARLFKRT